MPPVRTPARTLLALQAGAHRVGGRLGGLRNRAAARFSRTAPAPTASDLNVENVRAAADKLGVAAELLPNGFLKLSYGRKVSYARSAEFEFERLVPWLVCGDKWLTGTLLAEQGLPVPRFGAFDLSRYDQAERFFEALDKPVVTKPARNTAGGAGITLDIVTPREFRAGFTRARAYGAEVLVEEQVEGDNLRVTILDGRILGAVRRLPAHVVGDGRSSVSALVAAKNELWRSRSPDNRLLRPIEVDAAVRRILERQALTVRSVPEAGRRVLLRQVSNADQGGEIVDVAGELHEEQRELALAAARVVGPVLAGVDLISRDPTAPLASAGVVINEVNTTPSLYVANELEGGAPSTYAAEEILRRLFAISSATS